MITLIKEQLDEALNDLYEYCIKNTNYTATVDFSDFPIEAKFEPDTQQTLLQNDNYSDVIIEVGVETKVKSAFLGSIDADVLKKLIKLTKKVADLYYMYCTLGRLEH